MAKLNITKIVPLLLLAAIALLPSASRAQAPVSPFSVVAVPGTFALTYGNPVMAVPQNAELDFVNLDIATHDVVSRQTFATPPNPLPPWCCVSTTTPCPFPPTACPLFWSPLIVLGKTAKVLGLENTTPGQIYDFYCTVHPNMFGKLIVLPPLP